MSFNPERQHDPYSLVYSSSATQPEQRLRDCSRMPKALFRFHAIIASTFFLVLLTNCGSSNFKSGDTEFEKALGKTANEPTSDDAEVSADQSEDVVSPNDPDAPANQAFGDGERVDDIGAITAPSFGLDESVVFGDTQVFRIGDGLARGSSCKDGLDVHELKGTTYFFSFDVLNPATTVEIKIENICGIDLSNYASASLISESRANLESRKLDPGQGRMEFGQQSLDQGRYSIVIKTVKATRGRWRGHVDDFIVGNIKVFADKKITPGSVIAE